MGGMAGGLSGGPSETSSGATSGAGSVVLGGVNFAAQGSQYEKWALLGLLAVVLIVLLAK